MAVELPRPPGLLLSFWVYIHSKNVNTNASLLPGWVSWEEKIFLSDPSSKWDVATWRCSCQLPICHSMFGFYFDPLNTPRAEQNGWHFPDAFLKEFSFGKTSAFGLQCHWSSVLMVRLTMSQHWFRHLLGPGETTGHYWNQWEASLLMYKLYMHRQASTCSFLWPKSTNISISQEGSIYLIIFAHKSNMIKMLSGAPFTNMD